MRNPNPGLSVRDVRIDDTAEIDRYWADATDADLARMGELARPEPEARSQFIASLIASAPPPETAEEGILIWELDGRAIGYCTLKAISFGDEAQIHLHMWDRLSRGKGHGAVLFCLSALRYIDLFCLKKLYCQPKSDNPMPNGMLRRIGFAEEAPVDYRRRDGSVIRQSRFLIAPDVARRYLAANRPDVLRSSSAR